jgi:hypothetical protein
VLETPHVIVGAAIAARVVNPLLSFPLILGSHFLLDKVPHWNPHLNTEMKKYGYITRESKTIIVIDSTIAALSGLYIASLYLPDTSRAAVILFGGLLGVLPDIIEAPYFFLKQKTAFIDKWIKFQKSIQVDAPIVPGLTTQILTSVVALWWIFS